MTERYRGNAPRFVDETIDGEALIMDMVKGTYYSCIGASAFAWNALKAGATSEEVCVAIAEAYSAAPETVRADVDPFLASLLAEEMLVPASDDASPPPTPLATPPGVTTTGEYAALRLERFTDLADLILLDPVHDVTEAGWPHVAE